MSKDQIIDILKKAKSRNIPVYYLDSREFQKKFPAVKHQGIVLQLEKKFINQLNENDFFSNLEKYAGKSPQSTLLILDGIEDVGNFAAVLRSALLFGVQTVILPVNHSAPINDVVIKRSAGAAAQLNILYVKNIVQTIEKLKKSGYWIYALDLDGQPLQQTDFHPQSVIVMGSEHKGVRPLVRKNTDYIITIPTNQKIDSLNLSVSAGIALYEIFKKNQ